MLMHDDKKIKHTGEMDGRKHLGSLIEPNGIGIELGVLRGDYSVCLLENSQLDLLISVDAWCYPGFSAEDERHSAIERLKKFGSRSVILHAKFEEVLDFFPDGLFDFIYIDGFHSLAAVTKDLADWWPKLRPGGVFAGHDYSPFKSSAIVECRVIEAVNEHVSKYSLDLYITDTADPIDTMARSWYCWK